MNNNFYFYEVLQREKFEQMQKESEKARLLRKLSKKKETVNLDNRLIIQEKLAQFQARLKLALKSLRWSLR
jgi:hypothetical protein